MRRSPRFTARGLVLALSLGLMTVACDQVFGLDSLRAATSGADSGSGTVACNISFNTADCASCIGSNCCTPTVACTDNADCAAAINCVKACNQDSTCESDCVNNASPAAQTLFATMANCWSNSCATPCGL
jgi:hypothetical protein